MDTSKNILDLLQLDVQLEDVKISTDIYSQTKEILDKTNLALGRKVEYGVVNMTSANTYNISPNEYPFTH